MPFDNFDLNNLIYFRLDNANEIFWAIVEILCITYFIYVVLNLVRETRAWQLLRGILLILVIMAIANIANLKTLAYFLNNTFGVMAIGIVVVFQPELRRGLEQIGRSTMKVFSNAENRMSTGGMVDAVVRACLEMSTTFTGALIVIEREIKLGEIIDTGILLGADVSSELLINIFTKNTPLHDGAVIIRELRIEAATCYLPLSDDTDIEKDLGTRHRAAIGMTENSDAIVIVVSEETGTVSFVLNGVISRKLNGEQLRKMIMESIEEFNAPVKKLPFLKNRVKN